MFSPSPRLFLSARHRTYVEPMKFQVTFLRSINTLKLISSRRNAAQNLKLFI
jgi:hypothetical protein